jgi:cytochrome c oxidase subunit III
MDIVMQAPRKNIHPHKFTLWVAIGSIVMMFAGLTSAYIIKRNLANWVQFDLPVLFYYSTAIIIISSITMRLSQKALTIKDMPKYRQWLLITTILGVLFVVFQTLGFVQLWNAGVTLQKNVSFSFLYVIVGLHALHVVGGVVALIIIYLKAFSRKQRIYSSVPIDLISTYWYFVDVLWIYLLIFLILIR